MVGALTAALVLTLGSTALAAGHGAGWRQADQTDCPWCGAGCAYVDADGDGVCDHLGAGNRPQDGAGYRHGGHAGGHHGGWGR